MIGFSIMMWFVSFVILMVAVALLREQDEDIDSDVIKMAMILQQIQNKELRKIAIEQVKVFTFHQ